MFFLKYQETESEWDEWEVPKFLAWVVQLLARYDQCEKFLVGGASRIPSRWNVARSPC